MSSQTTIYFEIQSAVGGFVWRIRTHGNHEILCSSEILNNRQTCVYAMNLVRAQAGAQQRYWNRDAGEWGAF
jgi:uncharacterized protein YegP (UPF0339 family)